MRGGRGALQRDLVPEQAALQPNGLVALNLSRNLLGGRAGKEREGGGTAIRPGSGALQPNGLVALNLSRNPLGGGGVGGV